MYLVYEYVQAECMETPVNEKDMRLFATPVAAVDYAEWRRCKLQREGLCDFYEEFDGWKLNDEGYACCTLYYTTPMNNAGEPKEYVEIRVTRLSLQDANSSAEEKAIQTLLSETREKLSRSLAQNGWHYGRTDSYGYKMQTAILEEALRRINEESVDDKAKLQRSECFVPNNHPYPLCVGGNEEKCKKCCLNERYEEYNDPYENIHK